MYNLVMILHILVCFAIIFIILLQKGKGTEMGAAFGGSSQTIFGSTGAATFLNKLTTVVAVLFMFTSLLLAHISVPSGKSSVVTEEAPITQPAPQTKEKAPSAPANTQKPASSPTEQPASGQQ